MSCPEHHCWGDLARAWSEVILAWGGLWFKQVLAIVVVGLGIGIGAALWANWLAAMMWAS